MKPVITFFRWLRSLGQTKAVKQDIDEELRFHIEQRTAENIVKGMSPEEAAREARRRFGNVQSVREECRDVRGASFGEETWRDIRFTVRQLRKSPGFTTVAVFSLALGIGAGTAVFSLVNAILLRSLPVPNPHELRVLQWAGTEARVPSFVGNSTQSGNRTVGDAVSHPTFLALRNEGAGIADVFGFCPLIEVVARVRNETFAASGMLVSDNFFSSLGVRPLIGQSQTKGEDDAGSGMDAVLTYDCWQQRYNRDPDVLGRTIVLNGADFTIIGVLPRNFAGVRPGEPCDLYVPMSARSPFLYRAITENDHWFVQLMARLRPGTSDARLKAALNVAFARATAPVVKQPDVLVEPGHGGLTQDRNRYRKPLLLMLGVVGLVMLAACANLTGLSLARGAVRAHELAVRSALGANRWRLFRQALTESIVLTLLGGGLGILLAISGRSAIARLLAGSASGLHYDFSLDFIVLSFSMVIGLITALLSGLWPALRASRVAPVDGLRSRGTMGAPRLRSGRILVASQICLSLLLLTGAGLYVRTLANLTRINAGFSVEKLLIAKLNIRSGDYANNQPAEFYKRVENAIAVLPGVQAVTVIEFPLLAHVGSSSGVDGLSGRSSDPTATTPMQTQRLTVSEAFFTTMGIPILQGRGFAANDAAEAPKVVVVNESFVRDYLPNDDPIGISFSVWSARWQIVGVCRDAKYSDIKEAVKPTTFFPITQRFYSRYRDKHLRDASIAVRTALSPLALSTAVRKVVAQIDPGVAVTQITTQKVVRDQGISQERLLAVLCCSLAGLAVLLSCIGLYSLIAYNVARCTGEIGIRMALGATRRNIAWPILREAVLLALAGVAIGVPVALALARFVKSQLYGVAPTDPTTLIGAGVLLMIVAIFSAWIPARRATKVDPMVALRHE